MTLPTASPSIDVSPPLLTDPFHRAASRDGEPPNKAWAPPDTCCPRCGGLLVPDCTSSLERDAEGKSMTLWRCVNCGDCVDRNILANRGKGSGSARVRARPPVGPQRTGLRRGGRTGMAR